jgi:psp operon transcriptional activator
MTSRTPESIIGSSAALAEALEHVSRLARINRPILLLGERGTGKELAAERLHFLSLRWQSPLVKVNCAALADSLLESELFGHEPGSFTGATRTHRGRFERADGGTLFLDELGAMSARLQEKLLRLVEYGEFERLGGQQTLHVDVRVIAATNSDLRQQVALGQFRADLLDRLSFDVVHLPALRHRNEDIAELAQYFAVQFCAEMGWSLFAGFTPTALRVLQQHSWPGNVRELKNTVERSLFRSDDPQRPLDVIIIDPFHAPFAEEEQQRQGHQSAARDQDTVPTANDDFQSRIRDFELQLLTTALSRHGNHQRRTATALGLSYDQMRGLVRKHKLTSRND